MSALASSRWAPDLVTIASEEGDEIFQVPIKALIEAVPHTSEQIYMMLREEANDIIYIPGLSELATKYFAEWLNHGQIRFGGGPGGSVDNQEVLLAAVELGLFAEEYHIYSLQHLSIRCWERNYWKHVGAIVRLVVDETERDKSLMRMFLVDRLANTIRADEQDLYYCMSVDEVFELIGDYPELVKEVTCLLAQWVGNNHAVRKIDEFCMSETNVP